MNRQNSITVLFVALLCGMAVHAAIPSAITSVWEQMKADGVEQRAGYDKALGVFVVAKGEAQITGTTSRAKTVARANALENLAGFLGTQIDSVTKRETTETTVGEQSEIREFFSKTTKTQVKQLLKGVQDLSMDEDGDTMVSWIYLTTKAQDKSK